MHRTIKDCLRFLICRFFHGKFSMVFHIRHTVPYRICFVCGKEFHYDTIKMKFGKVL